MQSSVQECAVVASSVLKCAVVQSSVQKCAVFYSTSNFDSTILHPIMNYLGFA